MGLLHPYALFLFLLLPLLFLPWVRQPSRKVLRVSSIRLWNGPRQHRRRLSLRPIPANRSLFLQLLFCTALVIALAEPVLTDFRGEGRRLVFIFDASASMNALEGGAKRFDLARQQALDLVERLSRHDRVQILLAGRQPKRIGDFVSDRPRLRALIADLAPGHGEADLQTALTLALAASPDLIDEIVIFGDESSGWISSKTSGAGSIRYVRVGRSTDNLAITRLAIRSDARSPLDDQLFAEVANLSDRTRAVPFTLSVAEQTLLTETHHLEPGQRKAFSVRLPPLAPGREQLIRASIDQPDALALDNRAYALHGGAQRTSVLLVTEGNRFLSAALEADPSCALSVIDPASFRARVTASDHDVVILDGIAEPPDERGGYLVIARPTRDGGSPARLRVGDREHALIRDIDLEGLTVAGLVPLGVPSEARVLLESEGEPVALALEREGVRKVVLGFDIRRSEWPLSVSFPIFVSRAVHWLRPADRFNRNLLFAGETLDWRLPEAARSSELEIVDPTGAVFTAHPSGGRLVSDRTEISGVYRVSGPGLDRRYAVNALSERESDLMPRVGAPAPEETAAPDSARRRGDLSLSRYLVLIALVLLAVDGVFHGRRRSRRPLTASRAEAA